MKKSSVGILIVAVVIVVLAAVILTRPESSKQNNLKIGLATWVGYAPFYIAEEKGYLSDEGIKVTFASMDDQATRRAALSSGDLDAMVDTLDSLANGLPAGLRATCVLKIDDSYGGDGIVVTKDVATLADLKGKTVAYQKGLPPQFFLLYLLKKNGLTTNDIKSIDMEASAAAGAFIAKKVDAAVTWEPWLSKAGQTEHGKVLINSMDAPGLITDIFVVRPEVLTTKEEAIRKLLRAWFKSLDFIKSNPKEATQIMGKRLGLPAEEIEGMLMGIRFASYDDNIAYFGLDGSNNDFDKLFQEAVAVWVEEGSVDKAALRKSYTPSGPIILKGLLASTK